MSTASPPNIRANAHSPQQDITSHIKRPGSPRRVSTRSQAATCFRLAQAPHSFRRLLSRPLHKALLQAARMAAAVKRLLCDASAARIRRHNIFDRSAARGTAGAVDACRAMWYKLNASAWRCGDRRWILENIELY